MLGPLTSKERMLRTVRWEPVDRVPILSPIRFDPLAGETSKVPAVWQNDPNYHEVAELAVRYCDHLMGSVGLGDLFDRRFLLIPQEYIELVEDCTVSGRCTTSYRVRTLRGDLSTNEVTDEGVYTSWYTEALVKSLEDAEKLLSVPYHFEPPDLDEYFAGRQRLGDRGLMEIYVSTPMVCVSRLLKFNDFFLWCATERKMIDRLIETVFERIYERLEYLLQHGAGPVFWLGGSEQATPPMMSPQFYDELVVPYDGQLIDLIHKYGQYAHVHCHGRINGIFDRLLEMGADMLDPVEPPPDGDITIREAKRRAHRQMTLLGNIEFRHLEFCTPEQIDTLVREAICAGGKQGIMLFPSERPITALSDCYKENAAQYIYSGLRYGQLGDANAN